MKILGRDPALLLMLLVLIIQNLGAFAFHWQPTLEAWIIAAMTAAWGVVVALIVHDGQVAAILGFVKATVALVVGLGVHWTSGQQALLMSLVVVLLAVVTRTQVQAPVSGPLPPPALVVAP